MVTPLKTLMGFSVHLNVQLKFYNLPNSNVSITKNWANAGSINGRNVDFHETFHDFVAQNNPGTDGISSIKGVDTNNPYLILISSNAVDNIDVYNANFQETFWFTYSDDRSIVDITKFDQAHAAQNNNQIFYFLSASLSSNNGVNSNRREYVQTNDAKTVVISKNPIYDPSTGFRAPASTIGLTSVSGSNVPNGLVYTNTDPSGYQSHDGEDSNPDYYALQGGVTFANFTSNKPTLYLGAVPINNSTAPWWWHGNRPWWWHGNHNKNSDFLSFVTYSIVNNKKVNETINYVDQTGKTVAPSYTANPITFITVKAWNGTTTYYKFGSQEDPTLDNAGKPDSSWIQADNAKFGAIDNPTVKGYKVISTTAPGSDLNSVAIQTVNNTSDDLNFTVVYAPAYSTSKVKTVTETVHYVGQDGKPVANDASGIPTSFVTITNPIDGSTATYYSKTESGQPTINNNGVPVGDWTQGNSTDFAAIINPSVIGQHVVSTTDPGNDLTQTTVKRIDSNSDNLDFTVTYEPNQEAAKVTYIDDKTGKTLSAKDLTGDYGSTDPYRTGDTIADYEKQGYQLVSDNYPTNGVVYNQDGTVQSFEVHLTHGTTQTSESQTVNETIHYVYKNGDKAADDYQATPLNFTRTVTTDKVTGDKSYGDWVAANGTSFASVTSPTIKGYTPDQAQIDTITGITADSADIEKTVTYVANKETAKVTYIDDTTGKTLSSQDLSGDYGTTDSYRTADSIKGYEDQGYELVSDNYPTKGVVYNQDGTVQSFEVHLTHGTTPVGPNNPQTPGEPINPDNPDGPKWPEGTDKSSLTQTVIRTVNYLDKQTGKVVAKQVTEQVTYNRTAIVDKVTGQIIGYSTTGGDTVDQTDGDKAWTAVDNKSDWDSVTSPDLGSKGYLAPDLATVAQQTVTPGDKDVTVNVYYDHDVVPVNPTNPQTPGTPINPDDPDSPKWPAGTDKNSLTTDVHQTIHYQYGDGSQAAPDKTDSTTFDHQIEIDKVTGEIVKDDGWTAENGKTSFDSKNSPVIPGYTASKPASDSVDGLTQDSKDNVQTIIYTSNQESAKVTYIDDTTGKTLSAKALTGDYGSTDPYRTGDTIADYEKQGYQLVSDNYPTNGVVYNQDGTVQSFEVHLTHGTTQTSESQTINETIHYVYKNGDKAADDYQATPLNFTRTVTTDKVTGEKTYGSWSADQSFAAVTSPTIKGYTPDQAQIDTITGITADSAAIEKTVTYVANKEAAKVTYIDDTTGKTLSSQDLSGDYGTTDSYRTADSIKGYEDQGYELVSDNYPTKGVIYNQDGTVQSFEVHLTHGTTQTSESQTVNETIHYVYKNGDKAADDYQATPLNFTRTVTTDKVTGEKTYGSWSADQSFAAVTSPTIKGYTPDQAQIDTITGITADSAAIEKTVTYVANKEAAKVTYIDDTTGKTLSSQDLSGDYGTTDSYRTADSIKGYEDQGYELVSDNYPTKGVVYNQDGTVQSFEVHLTHGTTQTSESQTVNETIHYVYKNGDKAADDYQATPLNFTRTVTTDKVTGEKTYGSWSADQSFAAVTSPTIKGYTPDQAQIDTITGITADSAAIEKTVTYVANKEAAKVTYIDDTTGKTLSSQDLSGDYGTTDSYRTADSIKGYEDQGYELVSDNYPTKGVVYNQDGTVQSFEVHLTHGTTPVGPNNPQTPGTPINPDNPDGPKWPEGTDKSSVTQTVIRTVNYLDKQTDKVVAKQVTEQVTYNRTAIVDKVTGQIIGYSTTGGDTVDQTDGDKAWAAVDNKSDWDSVTSPDLGSKGYLAPDLATVAQQTVTPGDKDVTVNVYYDHDVVLVNPTNPQTPGTPINPDDPDSPKWPAGTDKNSLTTDVHQTIHYQYGDGSQAAPDKTDSTTFDHQVEIDKVTGEIVKDDGWTAENGKTSFDSKNSPVIPGYTASKPASDSVDGLTQDSKDNVQTIVYTKNPATDNNGGTEPNQPGKPGNGTDTGNPSSNQPGNPSQPSNATNNGVINTSTNTESKVNNGAVNSPELPQTGENISQSQTMSFIGILLAMFGSLLGFLGIKKRRND
ncbi:mucin-binding protein [Limosilactobacillus fermentum]|uniref:mucin-binding protein n=1 Tax=Limosilactobacillus fermentum TaxID=1613 RepID=UPI001C006291|nr:LPXTG cell wall anchor domain-containing protein [Limosilactobacillus fermentum]